MACACKVNREISYLQKRYGNNTPTSKKSKFKEMFSSERLLMGLKKGGLGVVVVLALPFMFVHLLMNGGKTISVKKLVKHERE